MTRAPSKRGDLLNSLSMYFSSKRTALRSALQFRSPLSVEQAEDLRVHYSNYFINLLSGIDLVRDCGSIVHSGVTGIDRELFAKAEKLAARAIYCSLALALSLSSQSDEKGLQDRFFARLRDIKIGIAKNDLKLPPWSGHESDEEE